MLVCSAAVPQMAITRREYYDVGSGIVHKKGTFGTETYKHENNLTLHVCTFILIQESKQ
jgi:hypothetical protein